MWLLRVRSFVGLVALLLIAWSLSENRKRINLRTLAWGLCLQVVFAVFILKTGVGKQIFFAARAVIHRLLSFTDAGASFLFGNLYRGDPAIVNELGGPGPFQLWDPKLGEFVSIGTVFAFHILPTIIFFASLMAVLYHLGIMQRIVQAFAWVMARLMGTSGAESLSAASNIFVGQTEAPLVVRPYVSSMTMSELMAVMTGGFATIAGGVMAAYVRFGVDAGHLMAASVMSAPAALVMAKLMYPETETPETLGEVRLAIRKETVNVIDAAASGAADGLKLALNVGAMLMAFLSLIAMINYGLGIVGTSLREILGYLFSPIAFFLGVPTKDVLAMGGLLGTKISINEFVAYLDLTQMRQQIDPRTFVIATYALCGFANFGSIAIQLGGIGGIAPARRGDLARLGLRAMLAGALASWMTACIAGILI
ncbi:MAG: NupC/NupG family nucleoside CNT transporter [candidate division KSB1 bacterium]|nr:NupC/NupG family nucleoside CNT transporter [candidate division KSB1 bacterium]